jgi:hypothetical protein
LKFPSSTGGGFVRRKIGIGQGGHRKQYASSRDEQENIGSHCVGRVEMVERNRGNAARKRRRVRKRGNGWR